MEWTEETIFRLRELWQQGLSTAEIGRRMSITKNAVVGKAHRLILPARPSPIRKASITARPDPSQTARRDPPRPDRAPTAGEPSRIAQFVPRPLPAAGDTPETVRAGQDPIASITPLRPVPSPVNHATVSRASRGTERAIDLQEPRRRGQACCWPLGDPGTKQFRFCGDEPIQGKPYCTEHAQLAYVKLRDRRDTVA